MSGGRSAEAEDATVFIHDRLPSSAQANQMDRSDAYGKLEN
jgi:hypothetical protein